MFVVHSFMNGICNLLVSVCDSGNLGKQCFIFFPPPPFSFILRTRAFFSLRMFASVWLKTYLISFLSLCLKHVFLRSIHWLTFLTPSFAIMLFPNPPFLWTKSVSLHLKTNKFAEASGSEPNSKHNVQYPKKKKSAFLILVSEC